MNTIASVKPSTTRPSHWQRYIDLLDRERVPEKARPYYVRHVECFIAAFPGRRLSSLGATEIAEYLQQLARQPRLATWQFQQQVDALYLLLVRLNDHAEARKVDWLYWRARELDDDHPTTVADLPLPRRLSKADRSALDAERSRRAGRNTRPTWRRAATGCTCRRRWCASIRAVRRAGRRRISAGSMCSPPRA